MSDIDPKKLKVAELREELKARGLDAKGNKAQLVKRLEEAIAEESGDTVPESAEADLNASAFDTTTEEQSEADQSISASQAEEAGPSGDAAVEEDQIQAQYEAPEPEPEPVQAVEQEEPEALQESHPEALAEEPEEEAKAEADMAVEQVAAIQPEPVPEPEQLQEEVKQEVKEEPINGDAEMKEAPEDEQAPPAPAAAAAGGPEPEAEYQVMDAVEDSEAPEADQKTEQKMETDEQKAEVKTEEAAGDDRRGQKRRHSRSRSRSRDRYRRQYDRRPQEVPESEDWLQATTVVLDRFNCDLNMRVDEDGYKGTPISVEGFAFMWSGVRANFGVVKGQKCFEVKIKSHLNVDHLPEEEKSRHVVRVGWSTDCSSTQLGEEKLSYGYGGTAKASVDCKFQNYGKTFGEGDVVTAYIDFENAEGPIVLSYSVNGEDQGTCFEIQRDELGEKALFPHILSKNSEFIVNFGQQDEPMFPVKEGFTFMNNSDPADWVRGALPPAKKEDCEVIMMCGLPAAGKTVWAAKKAQENPEKRYNVLGTNNIIDKMKVMGLPRKKNYAGRWDVLIDKATKCLTRMLEVASKKKRNYVIDQTNVYPSAQRRKMRPFEGFQRVAVVIVPTDEEYKSRREAQQKEEGKDVPDDAILEMKANFALPEEGPVFDKVEFIELEREEASKLVAQYNKEGQAVFPPDQKRWRKDDNRFNQQSGGGGRDYNNYGRRDRYDNRDNYSSRGGSYNSYSRDRGYYNSNNERRGSGGGGRGNYNDRRSGGGGGGYMGYNDRQRSGGYGGGRDNRDNYRDNRNRRDDRGGGRDYNRSGSGSGSGGGYNNWNKGGSGGGGSGSGSGSWGNNQGSWGNNQGGWGQQGQWGQQGSWGQQGYNQQWGQQWPGYNQQGSQGWGQYGNYWNQQQQPAAGSGQQAAASQWSQYPTTGAWSGYTQQAAATGSSTQSTTTQSSSYNYGQQK